jgi:hypothetical protein
MPTVSPLLDGDGYTQGRTSCSRNPRCTAAEAYGGLDVMVKLEAGGQGGILEANGVELIVRRTCRVIVKHSCIIHV